MEDYWRDTTDRRQLQSGSRVKNIGAEQASAEGVVLEPWFIWGGSRKSGMEGVEEMGGKCGMN